MPVRKLVTLAIFIALAIGLKLALIILPNVEPLTVTFFLAGYMLGPVNGLAAGAIGEFLYSFFNPYGVASPPLLLAQVLCMSFSGLAGGWVRRLSPSRIPPAWLLGALGFFLTLIFDLATTLSDVFFVKLGLAGFLSRLAFGIYFYIIHLSTNTLLFAVLLPALIPRLHSLTVFRNLPRAQALSDRDHAIRAVAADDARLQPESASQDRRHQNFD